MDDEIDPSFTDLGSLAPLDSASNKSGTRGRSALATWTHSRPAKDNEPEKKDGSSLLYCRYCPESSTYSTSVTTNFRRHLQSKHQVAIEKDDSKLQGEIQLRLSRLYTDAESTGHTDEISSQILRKTLDHSVINEALISLIVTRNLPFRILEWPEFHAFCQVLNPEAKDYILTAHSTIPRLIEKSWNVQKDIVRQKLQSALSSIHLSLDIWTSPNRLLLLGICGHFVDQSQEKLSKALLALHEVGGHSGDEQFSILLPVLEDYGIVRKLGSVVGDNASTNDTLCRAIGNYLQKNENIKWDPIFRRIRCTGHIINLAVQAFLFHNAPPEELRLCDEQELEGEQGDEIEKRASFRAMGPLGKLHNIVVHIRGSPARTKVFMGLAGRLIPLDNRTRWNSWYQMLVVANEKAAAIDAYSKEYLETLTEEYLSPDDWKHLRTIMSFLQPFYRATLETQGDNATIDCVLFTMDVLTQVFESALVSNISISYLTLLILHDR